ncbi:MAG: hypothetical protein AAB270_07375 [Chloroflexota bacterium]
MRQMSLCPSCRHQVVVMRRGELVFCTLEQKLTHPHLVCSRFEPAEDSNPEAVRESQRRKVPYRKGELCQARRWSA